MHEMRLVRDLRLVLMLYNTPTAASAMTSRGKRGNLDIGSARRRPGAEGAAAAAAPPVPVGLGDFSWGWQTSRYRPEPVISRPLISTHSRLHGKIFYSSV